MKKIFLLTALTGSMALNAQQIPLSNQYTMNRFALSPAWTGAGEGLEVFGTYRDEWMNVQGAPETKMISANGMVFKNMGLGGTVTSHQAGIFQNISASASYAYHAKLSGGHMLSFGLGLGLLESRVNLAGAAAQGNDPVVANNADVNALVMDAGFGILYRFKDLHAGITLPRLLSSKIKNEFGTDVYSMVLHHGIHLGYKVNFNADWGIDPMVRISGAKNAPVFYELAIPIVYKKMIWLSPIYKKTDIAIGIGGMPYKNFIVSYSFEFASKGIMGESSGSHEITLGWKMGGAKKQGELPKSDKKKPYIDWILK